ncbi:MAG: hypothetical protein GY835_23210 [bacterium]|nr:hypothetical protein [bacterium]
MTTRADHGFTLPLHSNAAYHRRVMESLETMTPEEALERSVKAGIHTPDGKLTAAYKPPEDEPHDRRDDEEPL